MKDCKATSRTRAGHKSVHRFVLTYVQQATKITPSHTRIHAYAQQTYEGHTDSYPHTRIRATNIQDHTDSYPHTCIRVTSMPKALNTHSNIHTYVVVLHDGFTECKQGSTLEHAADKALHQISGCKDAYEASCSSNSGLCSNSKHAASEMKSCLEGEDSWKEEDFEPGGKYIRSVEEARELERNLGMS